ncbi:MAG: bifunctional folylpolyglutamate synthase/dihydrofolate synthase [Bacteroidales bacterium]|nr:bifunctional folylpolyglutamate synthase/dihydrofolate synthase [Bacteroidales bacterium]
MNYEQTLEYLFQQLPMFQRIGNAAYKADLKDTIALDNYLDNPHKKFKTIHIAGTNGKGSTAHSLASVLQEAGYKTGLYTSPHYLDFRERIRINGEMVSKEFVIDFTAKHSDFFTKLSASFFQITVAMAFEYFAQQNIDVAVIEVGMGGRLDSTNIISPILSIITNIGYDHTQFLGTELTQIAGEKAGIIKKNIPIVIGETKPEIKAVFSKKAQQVDAPIFFADHSYSVKNYVHNAQNQLVFNIEKHGELLYEGLIFELPGEYQQLNIAAILNSVELLKKHFNIDEKNIRNGLKRIVKNTGIMGRWQTLSENPKIICDAGHNYDGILNVVSQLKQLNYKKLHFVFGAVNDKDLSKIFRILPSEAEYYFTKAQIPRSLNEKDLQNQAENHGLQGETFSTVEEAIKKANEKTEENELIFIGGSTFVVAEAIDFYKKIKKP